MTRRRGGGRDRDEARVWSELERRAAGQFGLRLSSEVEEKLREYAEGLWEASARVNLVSAESVAEIACRHILDALAPLMVLPRAGVIADVGSGAGLPGVPLAVACPGLEVVLVESRRRRANFLRDVRRRLELENVRVVEERAESFVERNPGMLDGIVGRGVKPGLLGEVGWRGLREGGIIVTMGKAGQAARVCGGFERRRTERYELPEGERHEVVRYERERTGEA